MFVRRVRMLFYALVDRPSGWRRVEARPLERVEAQGRLEATHPPGTPKFAGEDDVGKELAAQVRVKSTARRWTDETMQTAGVWLDHEEQATRALTGGRRFPPGRMRDQGITSQGIGSAGPRGQFSAAAGLGVSVS